MVVTNRYHLSLIFCSCRTRLIVATPRGGSSRQLHETVSVHPAKTDAYHVADFRHANDASFVDFVHKHDFVDSAVSFKI